MDFEGIDGSVIEITGKHGTIRLIVPNRRPTLEELERLHRVIAETMVNSAKKRQLFERWAE
ncbi:hypothetical protein [Neobacillus sp. FSL H8-0543]|uniref:hypothetical protein n=1 Tax=Neobacillus sp. FSL H8-0543 TaxID=2954672 RepID=UPI0031595389